MRQELILVPGRYLAIDGPFEFEVVAIFRYGFFSEFSMTLSILSVVLLAVARHIGSIVRVVRVDLMSKSVLILVRCFRSKTAGTINRSPAPRPCVFVFEMPSFDLQREVCELPQV